MRIVRLWSLLLFIFTLAGFAMSPARAVEVQAGPIWNNTDAQGKCPRVCQQSGNRRWNGQWHTIQGTATSVCDCDGGAPPNDPSARAQWTDAGPLFNQMDAQNKCPAVCGRSGLRWDGNWKTTDPGRNSVCSCAASGAIAGRDAGASCNARSRGGCSGCSVQCALGQRASCQEGSTWNDKVGNGDRGCVTNAQCTCN